MLSCRFGLLGCSHEKAGTGPPDADDARSRARRAGARHGRKAGGRLMCEEGACVGSGRYMFARTYAALLVGNSNVVAVRRVQDRRGKAAGEGCVAALRLMGLCTQSLRPQRAQGQPDAFCVLDRGALKFGWPRTTVRLHGGMALARLQLHPAFPVRLRASNVPPSPLHGSVFSRFLFPPPPPFFLPSHLQPHRHGS